MAKRYIVKGFFENGHPFYADVSENDYVNFSLNFHQSLDNGHPLNLETITTEEVQVEDIVEKLVSI